MVKSAASLRDIHEERTVPWGDPGQFAWHLARYRFAAALASRQRVLDVGCGEGYGSAILAETAASVVAVDYSPAAIEHASRTYRSENLRFEAADATRLPSHLGLFDLVVCLEVIEHIEEDDELIAGMARLCHPGGLLVLSTPNARIDRLFETIASHEHYAYHVNLLTPAALRRKVRRHFRRVALYGQSYRGTALYTWLKALDVFNVRHRLVRSPQLQEGVSKRLGRQAGRELHEHDFQFNRWLVAQSPHTIVKAVR